MESTCSFPSIVGGQCGLNKRDRNKIEECIPFHNGPFVELIQARARIFSSSTNIDCPNSSWPKSESLRATVKTGQSLSQGHHPPIYQQTRKGFLYFIIHRLISTTYCYNLGIGWRRRVSGQMLSASNISI